MKNRITSIVSEESAVLIVWAWLFLSLAMSPRKSGIMGNGVPHEAATAAIPISRIKADAASGTTNSGCV